MQFCRSAPLTDLAGLGPTHVVGFRSRHALRIGQSQSLQGGETCCWSGSYSILYCRNVSVLPKKLAVRDCDDLVPRVTTLLSSYAPRSKLSAYSRPSCRPTMKKSSPCQNVRLQFLVEEMTRRCHASGKSSSLQNLSVMLSPSLGCVRRSVHRLSQFPTHNWLLCLGVFVWQSNEDVADRIGVRWARLTSAMEIRKGSFTRKTSSWHATLSRIRKNFQRSVAEKIGSTPLWRTSVHTRRERYRGASAFPLLVLIHLRPTGLRPVRAVPPLQWSTRTSPCPTNTLIPSHGQF